MSSRNGNRSVLRPRQRRRSQLLPSQPPPGWPGNPLPSTAGPARDPAHRRGPGAAAAKGPAGRAASRTRSVGHSEFPPDQIPDNLACPQRILELKLPRIAPDNPPAELLGLRLVKLRSSPRSFPEREERIQAVGLVI